MTQLELLLPFSIPQEEMARDLLRELNMPALATLLARAGSAEKRLSDGFARALPHEYWLAQQYDLSTPGDDANSPALAIHAMQAYQLKAEAGVWFLLQPVHLHIARDHLVLTDMRQLQLAEDEARALFELALSVCEESGKSLLYGDAHTWFLRADDWQDLHTSTPDAACGHNIDIWMPKGQNERNWRRLQNEIQMHWHAHAINDERAERGLKPVNSVWLWGGTAADASTTSAKIEKTYTFDPPQISFPIAASQATSLHTVSELLAAKPQHGLLILDSLIEAALAGDWSEWLMRFQAMEAEYFAPLLQALKNGQLDKLIITTSHNTACSTFSVSKSSLRKFWRKPSLTRLQA